MASFRNVFRSPERDRAAASVSRERSRSALRHAASKCTSLLEAIEPRLLMSAVQMTPKISAKNVVHPTLAIHRGRGSGKPAAATASRTGTSVSAGTIHPLTSGSSHTLRIAEYNIDASDQGNNNNITGSNAGIPTVIQAIGQHHLGSNAQPVDVLLITELLDSTTLPALTTALNNIYGTGTYAYDATPDPTSGGSSNGPSGLIYNTNTVQDIAAKVLPYKGDGTDTNPRAPMRYQLRPVGVGSSGDFYVYVSHLKSGTSSTDKATRVDEAGLVRTDENTLPASASVLYVGDFNANPSDGAITTLTASGQGQLFDPANLSTSNQYLTCSTTSLGNRYDYEMMTSNVLNDTGSINYVSGSYQVFGNNGTTATGTATDLAGNTALSDLSNGSTVLADMMQPAGSDHLPVVADFTFVSATGTPTIGSFTDNPTSVTTGTPTTLTASNVTETGGSGSITGVNFYRESNSTSGLQIGSDTLVGAGTANGSTYTISASTTGLAAGTYTFYAVATDSNGKSSSVASTTLIVTSSSSSQIHGTVLAWDTNGQSSYGTQGLAASTVATGATNSTGLTRGSGVGTSGTGVSNGWGGNNWASTSSAGISGNEFVTFGFTVGSGYSTSLSSIGMNYRRSSTGPSSGYWQYQVNGGAWGLIGDESNEFSSTSSSGAAIAPISLTGISALQNLTAGTVVNFRLVPYGATGSTGTLYVYDGGNNTNDLVVTAS